jgi:hypothetical protein
MSTRGAYGFKMGGKQWIAYNHWDSYYSGLGQDVANWATKHSPEEVARVLPLIEFDENYEEKQDILFPFIVTKKMYDDSSFIDDTLFCEYYYILDIDQRKMIAVSRGLKCELDIPWGDNTATDFKAACQAIKEEALV